MRYQDSPHEPDLTSRGINENICRLHVLVDQLLLVQPAECGCGTDGEAQKPRPFHRPWKEAIESLTARILEHERHLPTLLGEGQGPNRPGRVQFIPQRVFELYL